MTYTAPDYSKLSALLAIANDRVKQAEKRAFVPTDAAASGGAGGAPMDPAMAGGSPAPVDPAMAGGGMPRDPVMMGGGVGMPMDPAMSGGGDPMEAFRAIVKEELAASGAGGGAAGAAAGGIKPKIDVNVEIMQMKKLLARIADALGVHIPAAEMVATPQDLAQKAQPAAAPAGAGAPPPKTAVDHAGVAYAYDHIISQANDTRSRAAALAEVLDKRC